MLFAPNKTWRLSPADAATQAKGGRLVLIDVREPDERLAARPAGSLHIPQADLPARLGELPSECTVAFVCRSGRPSAMAARAEAERGLPAADVRGGPVAWGEAGPAVECGPERPTNATGAER
jgi:rhodanese-related sulfurtransferase